ncbi:SPOR domain-containing protein [uncultured Sphingomonas sp.]|uniref:SPOR domain-containing protein n=1 Tax=uncultured Sphingomonas sp. TaxID=158754 RepID=UPI0035CC6273
MTLRRLLTCAVLGLAIIGLRAGAQTADENRDADALAADMRILATNPLDIEALTTAGELTLKMGDNIAAAGFFARAEKLEPLNPRIKAGMGVLLVRAERPGEALRRFQEAEARGYDPRRFAADRGLAYDLIGEPDRAQRDYRLALAVTPSDETTRRYALSLGISGKSDLALAQLDPLLRRSDRAAWRDRAFILAMNGDVPGAQKIANTMISPGLGQGLASFFQRLPLLSPVDRAFAVHFGEVRVSPERYADARLIPPLPVLGPDPAAPKPAMVAMVVPKPNGQDRRVRRRKSQADESGPALAAAVPASKPALPPPPSPAGATAKVQPLPTAARPTPSATTAMVQPLPRPTPSPIAIPVGKPPMAAVKPRPTPSPTAPPATLAMVEAAPKPTLMTPIPISTPAPVPPPVAAADPAPSAAATVGVPATSIAGVSEDVVLARIIAGIDVPGAELGISPPAVASATTGSPPVPAPVAIAAPSPAPLVVAAKPFESRGPGTMEVKRSVPDNQRPDPQGDDDPCRVIGREGALRKLGTGRSATARTRAGLRCPAVVGGKAEIASTASDIDPCTPDAQPGTSRASAKGRASAARTAIGRRCAKLATNAKVAMVTDDSDPCASDTRPGTTAKRAVTGGRATSARRKASSRCPTAGTAIAPDSTADDACAIAGKSKAAPAATKSRPIRRGKAVSRCAAADAAGKGSPRGEPARVWVQVAGGANQAALEKEWARLKAGAPDLFKGRTGWSTPLRATNRVLTGPFRNGAEAQDFVNDMARAGLSGFVFTSPPGQKVDRLSTK